MFHTKLDRVSRRWLEGQFRERQRADLQARHDASLANLRAATLRRLEAAYRPMQSDMPVLAKYKLCAPIKGCNFRVWNPATKLYDERLGVEVETDLLAPGEDKWHDGTTVVEAYVRPDDPDYAAFWAVVEFRRSYQDQQKAEFEAFAKAVRATSSWAVLERQFLWIAEMRAPVREAA